LRRDFERVLKQRNALLKSAPRRSTSPSLPTLEVWDDAFARAGAELAAARLGALAKLLPHAQGRYEDVAGGGRLELAYSSSWVPDEVAGAAMTDGAQPDVETLREALAASIAAVRVREIERGLSLSGPQRDDILVQLRGGDSLSESLLDARTYASQGDQRTSALALKLGEHDLLAAALDDQPILLLDDVFSELDPSRRSWLAKTVLDLGQTIVSATDLGDTKLAGTERVFEVHRGAVSQA
jgi:DNA replication and repair protein RecF